MGKLLDGLLPVAAGILLVGVVCRSAAARLDPVGTVARSALTDANLAAFVATATRELA
ncbi:hypothetical protein [Nocardioides dongkuii]|uniref:hypothetical protein n=1 Tax=Nocardioides dongkuii TaxID=2760089 RepID=UPI0018776595|nr:hypothetical protein [Nocardioides dongkuii]